MRALTLTQPWCGLVASGIKLIENRPRTMIKREDFGKPFALHASREVEEEVYARIREIAPELRRSTDEAYRGAPWYRLSRVTSAVIAVATIDRYVIKNGYGYIIDPAKDRIFDLGDQHRWFFGPIAYVLRDVRALPQPVPCRGALGFWTLPDDIEALVTAQLVSP